MISLWLTSLSILSVNLASKRSWPFIPRHPYSQPVGTEYLPYCSCTVYPDVDTFGCECFSSEPLTEETNFPDIPANVTYLRLGVRDEDFDADLDCLVSEASYSYINADTGRIPKGTPLTNIKFTNFAFDDDSVRHFNHWLDNVKDSLTDLSIACGRLVSLRPEILRGLSKLKLLNIHKTGLAHIEPGAFGELGFGSLMMPDGLVVLVLEDTSLQTFDWSVLLPVASTIQTFSMSRNRNLRTMQVTIPVLFRLLDSLELTDNAFETVPADVVATWPLSQNLTVFLEGNPLCPHDSLCRCCSLLPLIQFATAQTSESRADVTLNCGDPKSTPDDLPHMIRTNMLPSCDKEHYTNASVANVLKFIDMSFYDECNKIGQYNGTACTVR